MFNTLQLVLSSGILNTGTFPFSLLLIIGFPLTLYRVQTCIYLLPLSPRQVSTSSGVVGMVTSINLPRCPVQYALILSYQTFHIYFIRVYARVHVSTCVRVHVCTFCTYAYLYVCQSARLPVCSFARLLDARVLAC